MLQLKNVIQNNSLLYVLLLKVLHCFFFYTLNLLTIFTILNQKTAIFFLWSFFVESTIFIRYYKAVVINDKLFIKSENEGIETMTKRGKSILLLATIGVLLISGCSAKEEVLPETLVQSEEATKTESSSEPKSGNEQETKIAQTAPAKEIKYMDITHIFKPYEQAIEISLQIPEDWKYTIWDAENESPDWGYSINMYEGENVNFNIFGQFGTLTAADYSNEPKSFQTSQELTGQYFWDEYMLDDGNPAIQAIAVFDTELAGFYGVSLNMPKSIYSENKDIIDEIFQSIVIREAQ